MSVSFNSKSKDIEGDSWNLMANDSRSTPGWRGSVHWIVAAVCLGLLLLTVILVAHNTSAISQRDTKYEKLLHKIEDDLRDERDQLETRFINLTAEMNVLQSQYNTVVASRDKFQEEVNRLNGSRTNNACFQGWQRFNNKCYYSSANGDSKTWAESRKDCRERGGDLVIIDTKAELDFVKRTSVTWIGLIRETHRDSWKWVDGTTLVGNGFWQQGEPNNADDEEDCVEISRGLWNDVPCTRKFSWVCER